MCAACAFLKLTLMIRRLSAMNPRAPMRTHWSGRGRQGARRATKLPEEQRELIQLAFYKGWSHSEIARETELPLGTVKSRLRLAISRLRNELEERF